MSFPQWVNSRIRHLGKPLLANCSEGPRTTLQNSAGAAGRWPKIENPKRFAAALGWTEDQFRFMFQPLTEGKEATWSMGDDAAPAFLSDLQRPLWDYCHSPFACAR